MTILAVDEERGRREDRGERDHGWPSLAASRPPAVAIAATKVSQGMRPWTTIADATASTTIPQSDVCIFLRAAFILFLLESVVFVGHKSITSHQIHRAP